MAFYYDADGPDYEAIANAILNTDLAAFTGPQNSLGAFLRDRVLTVNKFMGLQTLPTLPDIPDTTAGHPYVILADNGEGVIDDQANRVVYNLYGPISAAGGERVVDNDGNVVVVDQGLPVGVPVLDAAGARVVGDNGEIVYGLWNGGLLDANGNTVVNDYGLPLTY